MAYVYCTFCKTRISSSNIELFCNDECKHNYEELDMSYCTQCNVEMGRQRHPKKFCSPTCHNTHQANINKINVVCPVCDTTFTKQKSNRNTMCSDICRAAYVASEERNTKRMQTLAINNKQKYGVEFTFQREDVKAKVIIANKLTFSSPSNIKEIVQKRNATLMRRYGQLKPTAAVEAAKKTKLERYGKLHFNEKSNITKMAKYGTMNFSGKANITKLKKYGTVDFSQKARNTIINKYGSLAAIPLIKSYQRLKIKYAHAVEFLFDASEYVGARGYKLYKFKCVVCDTIFEDNITNGLQPICPQCNPPQYGISKFQTSITEFIQSLGISNIEINSRSIIAPHEVDIYLPDFKLAIECNGVYWHSEISGGKSRLYHLNKTKQCDLLGIRLLHITDVEWNSKQQIVKNILETYITPSTFSKIYARNTDVKLVNSKDTSTFLEEHHIQGNDNSSIRLGLYHKEELVSVMTFKKSRFDKSIQWEISRFSTKTAIRIIGGASKLFSAFIQQYTPDSVISYSDRRLFSGQVYESIGFSRVSPTVPSYLYFKSPVRLESRQKYQKHKLPSILPTFDPTFTEWVNMSSAGYDRIWDCGNHKFVWSKPMNLLT